MAMRTITLKLYKPSKRKTEIIESALCNYTQAFQYLLNKASGEINDIAVNYRDSKGRYTAASIVKWINKDISTELNKFSVEPFKDSLKQDFSTTLSSYLSLLRVQKKVRFPTVSLEGELLEKALSDLDRIIIEESGYSIAKNLLDKYQYKRERFRPIFFCRTDINRDFSILYDPAKKKYYAKLYLMNVKDIRRKEVKNNKGSILTYLLKDKQILKERRKKERFLLLPLSFGKWQEQFLQNAAVNPNSIRTARLFKKKREFYLSINMDINIPEKLVSESYLGVARGIQKPIYLSTAVMNGEIIDSAEIEFDKFYNGKVNDNQLHYLANQIVAFAVKHKSQVVMMSFINKNDRLQWKQGDTVLSPCISTLNYNRIAELVDYKLETEGLPGVVRVSPVGTYYTCPECGYHSQRNRFSEDMFICMKCGTAENIFRLGSINLSRRIINYGKGILKIKVTKDNGYIIFSNKLIELYLKVKEGSDYITLFELEIRKIIKEFYDNIEIYSKHEDFKQKYSMIKKIEEESDFTKLIKVV